MSKKYYFISYETRGVKAIGMPLPGRMMISTVIEVHPFEYMASLPIYVNYYDTDEFDEVAHTLLYYKEISHEEAGIWRKSKESPPPID